jgi:hypothetical protein
MIRPDVRRLSIHSHGGAANAATQTTPAKITNLLARAWEAFVPPATVLKIS